MSRVVTHPPSNFSPWIRPTRALAGYSKQCTGEKLGRVRHIGQRDENRNGPSPEKRQRPIGLSVLFFASFFTAAFLRQSFLDALSFAGLQVKGVALNLLDDVFLLHLALEPPQRIFEGFPLLKSYFRQTNYTPKLVPLDPIVIARFRRQVKSESRVLGVETQHS
jgi:hypothetical protein